jgi:hypothetical protein
VAGRHREALAPGFESEEPAADVSSDPEIGTRRRQGRRIALLFGVVLVAALMVGGIGALLFGGTPGSVAKSAPRVPRPTATVEASPERITPAVYPTRGEYVPPIPTVTPTVTPTTHKPSPKAATTTTPTTHQRPACPFKLPVFHDWCVQHGFQPPKG